MTVTLPVLEVFPDTKKANGISFVFPSRKLLVKSKMKFVNSLNLSVFFKQFEIVLVSYIISV